MVVTERDFLDRAALLKRYTHLARDFDPMPREQLGELMTPDVLDDPDGNLLAKLATANMDTDDGHPDPDRVGAGLRAFDAVPHDERQKILNGWAPIDADRRPRGVDVLASLAAHAPLARVIVLGVAVKPPTAITDDATATRIDVQARQEWTPLDPPDAVRLVVQEGTPFEHVAAALSAIRHELRANWQQHVDAVPAGVFRRRRGQVWKAYDFQQCVAGYLITAENDLDRPIAFIDSTEIGGIGDAGARAIAEEIARNFTTAGNGRCIDLRAFGWNDSREPMPGWVYGLACEPLDADLDFDEMRTPRPFCRFLASRMQQQAPNLAPVDSVDLFEPAVQQNGGSPNRPTVPQPASKGNGKAKATAAV